jgi:hypothetical protein
VASCKPGISGDDKRLSVFAAGLKAVILNILKIYN